MPQPLGESHRGIENRAREQEKKFFATETPNPVTGNTTYFDGQCGSIYKQQPPTVNACRKPGEWQTYDILFTALRFDAEGKVAKPAAVTVLHNGVAALLLLAVINANQRIRQR